MGRVVYEGYDFGKRSYVFRQHDTRDNVEAEFVPSADQVNPVVSVTGWTTGVDRLRVIANSRILSVDEYTAHIANRQLCLWLQIEMREKTTLQIGHV